MGDQPGLKHGIPDAVPIPVTKLRPRQGRAMKAVFQAIERGIQKQLVSLPTGVGKTILATHVSLRFQKVLFLVHREELLDQTLRTFARAVPDERVGTIYGKQHNLDERFTVGMIQTVHARLPKMPKDAFDLVIFDEAHHAAAKTWRAVADHFNPRLRLGLSATPERGDGAPLNDLFTEIVYEMTILDAIKEDLLVRPKALQIDTNVSLDGVKIVAGDFHKGQLQAAINTPERNQLIVDAYLRHAAGRKALVFCEGVDHSRAVADCFNQAGVRAAAVTGEDEDRREKVEGLAKGDLSLLANAFVLTEGFDDPTVSAILMARPLRSKPLYAQIIGRGLRLSPETGKTDCIVLDFVDASKRHYLLSAWRFFGVPNNDPKDEPEFVLDHPVTLAQQAEDRLEAVGISPDPEELLAVVREVDLLLPPPIVQVDRFDGTQPWMLLPPSEKQVKLLMESGYSPDDWTRGQATSVIRNLPPSPKQTLLLLALGYDVLTKTWTRDQAEIALKLEKEKEREPDWSYLNRLVPGGWASLGSRSGAGDPPRNHSKGGHHA